MTQAEGNQMNWRSYSWTHSGSASDRLFQHNEESRTFLRNVDRFSFGIDGGMSQNSIFSNMYQDSLSNKSSHI
jgi:hypothetical protein